MVDSLSRSRIAVPAALIASLALVALGAARQNAETNRFRNNSFEEAGAPGSRDAGPGWRHDDGFTVFTQNWTNGCSPFHGSKAMGIAVNGTGSGGTLSQEVDLSPGDYDLTLQGRLYLWDTHYTNKDENTHVGVALRVDGSEMISKRFYTNDSGFASGTWGTVFWTWSGRVNSNAGVRLRAEARAESGGWGLCATDDWTFYAIPHQAVPTPTPVVPTPTPRPAYGLMIVR